MPLLGYIKNNKKVKNAYYLDIIGTPITYQDFMQLTPAQQENGNWYVTGMSSMVNAYSIMYKNGLNIGQALDEINADIENLPVYETLTFTLPSTTNTWTSLNAYPQGFTEENTFVVSAKVQNGANYVGEQYGNAQAVGYNMTSTGIQIDTQVSVLVNHTVKMVIMHL